VGAGAVLVENFDTGTIMYVNHGRRRIPIASLTKIMTAMLTIRSTDSTDVVTASRKAARQVPTKLGLHKGDRLDVDDLLYALLLHSSNDVAVALAEHVAGSVRAFDHRMTDKAAALGMPDTLFASPSGLNDRGYSTVRDLATLTRWAYRSDRFASIVATKHHRLTMPTGQRVRLTNLNDLLFEYPGAMGVKTGYTSTAHWSIVAVAERGATRMLVVVLGDPEVPFDDGAALLDWAFGLHQELMGRTA
jgi:serine-type D-Ala-D-Ala carboxypeptidase (penicillin-binding protein 5/6)